MRILVATFLLVVSAASFAPTASAHHMCPGEPGFNFGPVDALVDRLYHYYTCDAIDLVTTGEILRALRLVTAAPESPLVDAERWPGPIKSICIGEASECDPHCEEDGHLHITDDGVCLPVGNLA